MKVESLVTVILPVITDVPICFEEPESKKLPVISCVLAVLIPNCEFPDTKRFPDTTKECERNTSVFVIITSGLLLTLIAYAPLATKPTPEL